LVKQIPTDRNHGNLSSDPPQAERREGESASGGPPGPASEKQGSGFARPSEGSGGSGASAEGGAHRPPDTIVGDASP
jgi:hypothetical protein